MTADLAEEHNTATLAAERLVCQRKVALSCAVIVIMVMATLEGLKHSFEKVTAVAMSQIDVHVIDLILGNRTGRSTQVGKGQCRSGGRLIAISIFFPKKYTYKTFTDLA